MSQIQTSQISQEEVGQLGWIVSVAAALRFSKAWDVRGNHRQFFKVGLGERRLSPLVLILWCKKCNNDK